MLVSSAVQPALSMPSIRSPKASNLAWSVSVPSSIAVIAVSFHVGQRLRRRLPHSLCARRARRIDRMM